MNYSTIYKKIISGSSLLAATTALSYLLGFFRDRQFAHIFGASHTLDAYNAAFIVPDLILNIFVAGALSAGFVPVLTELFVKDSKRDTDEFISSVINSAMLVVFGVGVLAWILTPWLAHLVAPGFDAETKLLYVKLMRWILLSPIIFALSNTLGGVLISKERFFWFGISAALYNAGIIAGTALLAPSIGIHGAIVGVLAGAMLHLASRIWTIRHSFHYSPVIKISNDFVNFLKIMVPKMAGHPVEQLTFFSFTAIASGLGAGSIVVLNFARNFQSMPVSVVGLTFSLTVFPILARAVASKDMGVFFSNIKDTAKIILAVTIPAAIGIYLLRTHLITLLLGGGKFDNAAISATAATLAVFCLSIPTESLTHLYARAFYALKNSLTPVIITIVGLFIAVGTGWWLSKTMGTPGLALGFFAGSLVKVLAMAILLPSRPS